MRGDYKKFKAIFDTAMDAMLILNDELIVHSANVAADRLFKANGTLLGENLTKKLVNRRNFRKSWQQIRQNGNGRGELVVYTSDKQEVHIEYTATAKITRDKHLLVMRDITDRKIEEKRAQHFLGIASHELKSPLASIKAYTEILKRKIDMNPEQTTYLKNLDDRVDVLAGLINELLEVTRIRQGKLETFLELVNIDELLNEIAEEVQFSSTTHLIIKDIKVGKDIVGDKKRLRQVFINLLRNAIKYSPTKNKVFLNAKKRGKYAVISIKDEGIGVRKKDQRKIFDLYFRGSEKTTQNIQGLGVGLFIAREVVRIHGGKISVKSRLNEGSTFTVKLPLRQ